MLAQFRLFTQMNEMNSEIRHCASNETTLMFSKLFNGNSLPEFGLKCLYVPGIDAAAGKDHRFAKGAAKSWQAAPR